MVFIQWIEGMSSNTKFKMGRLKSNRYGLRNVPAFTGAVHQVCLSAFLPYGSRCRWGKKSQNQAETRQGMQISSSV